MMTSLFIFIARNSPRARFFFFRILKWWVRQAFVVQPVFDSIRFYEVLALWYVPCLVVLSLLMGCSY